MADRRKMARKVRAKEVEEETQGEDSFRTMPDDLIPQILPSIDASVVIRACLFSTRFMQVWKSLHHLNFDRVHFSRTSDFCKFVIQFLSRRNHHSDLSVLTINCTYGSIDQSFLSKISAYAASHNVQRLEISTSVSKRELQCSRLKIVEVCRIPHTVFNCHSLKQLYLKGRNDYLSVSMESWNLPALTTLFMEHFAFIYCCDNHSKKSVDLFSNLPNLKNLSLVDCFNDFQDFHIISPQLENLAITRKGRTSKFTVSAPKLSSPKFTLSAPKLSSFEYTGDYGQQISASDLHRLEKIYINIYGGSGFIFWDPDETKRGFQEIMNMFNQFRSATFVTLTLYTIEVLSWSLHLLEKTRSPFSNMKCLKIVGCQQRYDTPTLYAGVITYLRNSSPNSAFINESGEDFQDSFVSEDKS